MPFVCLSPFLLHYHIDKNERLSLRGCVRLSCSHSYCLIMYYYFSILIFVLECILPVFWKFVQKMCFIWMEIHFAGLCMIITLVKTEHSAWWKSYGHCNLFFNHFLETPDVIGYLHFILQLVQLCINKR